MRGASLWLIALLCGAVAATGAGAGGEAQACVGDTCPAKPLDVALFKAAFIGDAKKVKKHLKLGANPNWAFTGNINSVLDARLPSPKGSKLTPMHAAAWSGSKKALRRLLKAGGDANARSSDLSTPLIFAVMRNHAAAVKVLLKAGAATAPTDDGGMTAADWADDQDNAEIEAMLAAASAPAAA
jgi:ankyrin repeat protein